MKERQNDPRCRTFLRRTVCIIGLGYVGLPLAKAFSKYLKVMGFDIDEAKIRNSDDNINNEYSIEFTADPSKINQADVVLICVPTPVTKSKVPDLSFVKSAAERVGKILSIDYGPDIQGERAGYEGIAGKGDGEGAERVWY